MSSVRVLKIFSAGLVGLLLSATASATTVDLTPGAGSSGMIGVVTYAFDQVQPAGTGVLNSFLRIQGSGSDEQGYNTSNAAPAYDEKPPPGVYTRDVMFGELEAIGGNFLFVLDGGESDGDITLDGLQIYVSDTPSQNATIGSLVGTLLYDMDALEDSEVLMDNVTGNGISDMLMTVPESVFAGVTAGQYIILYSHFSDSGATFEEWAHVTVPEPGSLALLSMGLVGLAMMGRRRSI